MKYTVTYTETFARTVIVDADNEEEAVNKLEEAVSEGFIELTYEDYVHDSGLVYLNAETCEDDYKFFKELSYYEN